MAIAFARIQFVKRSAGQNACHKAAYNGRMAVTNERTGESYNYIQKGDGAYHAVLLPEGVNARFKDPKVLWNTAEKRETRINSQVALEGVIALPDDACITMEDRIEIAHRAAHHFFVRHGLAVQVDIHEPHDDEDHNWHAHFLATTRTFTPGGNALGEKAREYMARYREGNLHSGEEYRKIQNDYFAEKGYDLCVDENGIIAQAHLGPVRLRARAEALMQSHLERLSANQNASRDPEKILEHLTERNSVFTREDVERYLHKHVPINELKVVREAFWRQKGLIQLYKEDMALGGDPSETKMYESAKAMYQYTTRSVKSEEDRILRIVDRLQAKDVVFGLTSNYSKGVAIAQNYSLSAEQLAAFEGAVLGQRLVCIQGRAGTGKSHVMAAVREMIERNGYRVRGLAPTSSVAKDLESKGFEDAQNLHRFLFQQKNGVDPLNRKEVLMIDEAGMVGNTVMLELLKVAWDKGAQVILVGDDRQLSSVDRGGMFKVFCERYGAHELTEVRRQTKEWQKAMSETLSMGVSGVRLAVGTLEKNRCLHWVNTKDDALVKLVELWKYDRLRERVVERDTATGNDVSSFFIMEHRNRYALVLNEMIRNVRKEWGDLSGTDSSGAGSPGTEYRCETFLGTCYVSQGDRIQFRANDREMGVNNGLLGTLIETKENCFVVKTDDGREVAFNPQTFNRYQLGYAGTYHQSQGKTVDHAYALHSPYMTHNLFYVGVTRQKQDIHYIVSKDEARNRETLIAQLSRDGSKETTVRYLTPQELMKGKEKDKNSLFTTAFNYVRDKLYRNDDFYRVNDKITVNDETFRGYAVNPLTAQGARMAEQGETQIKALGKTPDLIQPAQRTITGNTRIRPPQSHQTEKGLDSRQELDLIVSTLKERIPEVCQALFPETQPQVRGHEWRYGAKGSLKVNISGPKRGGYANFETGDKGGPLHLICEARNCTMKEAITWAKSFLQQRDVASVRVDPIRPDTRDHPWTQKKDQLEAKASYVTWQSLTPTPDHPAPQLGEGCLAKLAHHNRETGRYTYADEHGATLFHVVRLEPKDVSKTGKMTLPLSYGFDTTSSASTPCWALKKYQSSDNSPLPLYNLKELMDHPTKPVLIVEGEKTAEAAQHIFPEMVVTTWHGGAGNVKAADLSLLKGREVVLWPDNDAIGHKAMETMAQRCKEAGATSIKIVGLAFGKDAPKLPEKWDLADPLPKGLTPDMLRQKLTDLDLPIVTQTLSAEQQMIVHYMEKNGFSPELTDSFHTHFNRYPKDAVAFFKERHSDWNNSHTLSQSKASSPTPSDPLLQKALEADKFIRIHERHIVNCQKLGDARNEHRFKETLETYKTELFKDKAFWDRVNSLEQGTCEHLKTLKSEALKAQQQQAQKDLSRGFER
ncbi:MAG: AAA family ATPase [Alphaproteobacteria bacterium]|nr:AAA family ATPase [Alphaproteobacteria bacterium]